MSDPVEQTAASQAKSTTSHNGEPPRDLTNRLLGEFRLLRRLGKGGMAEVYLAEQTTLKRQVAVKVLRPEYVADETYLKRFRHEAAAAGSLNHPNIVQVYMIGTQDGIEYIAQEYVQGRTLKDLMVKRGPLDVPLALHLLKQVALALQVAGQAGIVHRDIKPENILLTKKGEAKVADFGLAQLTQQGERVALTQVGVTMGTPLYMSPEQVAGKPVDHRSDLYSFGVMAYHLFAGKPPFSGESALAIAVQHLNETPSDLRQLRPDLPKPLCDCIRRLMAKKREDRYPDAQALLIDLRQISRQSGSQEFTESDSALDLETGRTPIVLPWRQFFSGSLRRQLGWMAVTCAGALLLGAAAGWSRRPPDPFKLPLPAPKSSVPKQENAQAQLFLAMSQGDHEESWKAVVNYFPEAKIERDRAELRLAMIYLRTDRRDEAAQIFDRFTTDDSSWNKAHGYAGKAYLQWLAGNIDDAHDLIKRAQAYNQPIDGNLARMLDEVNRGPGGFRPPRM